MPRSSFRLTSTQAAPTPEGHLIMSGPVQDVNVSVLVSSDGKRDIRARSKHDALNAIAGAGWPASDVELQTHEFEDPVTFDVREVQVWVPVPLT
jgi:hypothetical protein